jgi:hypothetical protein
MEPSEDNLDIVVKSRIVGGLAGGLGGAVVGGPVGAVGGGLGGAVVGGLVGARVYSLQQQQEEESEQLISREKHRQFPQSVISERYPTPNDSSQETASQFLVLVVTASKEDFIRSLEAKKYLDLSDGEALYKVTRYLWLGSETEFSKREDNISQYEVLPVEKSEFDIYFVYIELEEADERFKPNVNSLDRYDAFRKLGDLSKSYKISPRLRMEAYGNFDIYN